MNTNCTKCTATSSKVSPIITCDGCSKYLCKKCTTLSSSEIKVLLLKERLLNFFCDECSKFQTNKLLYSIIEDKQTIIESKNQIIDLLEEQLKSMENKITELENESQQFNQNFSEALLKPQTKLNIPCLVLKPCKQQNCQQTKEDLENQIDPGKISVSVDMLKNSRNGAIIIKCRSRASTEKMKNEINNKMTSNYKVEETKLRRPTVIVSNISLKYEKEELIETLKNQNETLNEDDFLAVKILQTTKKGDRKYAVLECNGSSYKKLMELGKISVGYNMCPIYENNHIIRCTKCKGYNHKSIDCQLSETCSTCSDYHSTEDCENKTLKCINCFESNIKYKMNYNYEHDAFDRNCPVYLQHIEFLKQRTDYHS